MTDDTKTTTTNGESIVNSREGSTRSVRDAVVLTEHEERIFAVLLAASAEAFPGRRVVLRVAGGWVRDKLLGTPSHDIDVAIDCMTGAEFAAAVRAFVDAHAPGAKETKVAVIKQNPEQSKHLETATMTVLGLPIDFVNLRAEEYSKTSRIPTIVCCLSFEPISFHHLFWFLDDHENLTNHPSFPLHPLSNHHFSTHRG